MVNDNVNVTQSADYEASVRETIILMYQAGAAPISIANEVDGVTPAYVRTVLREAGILAGPGRRESLLDKFDDATLEVMFVDYYQDMPIGEIMKKYNLARAEQFYRILHELGREPRHLRLEAVEGRRLRDEHALDLYRGGVPIWQIMDETGISQPRLHQLVHKAGIPGRRRK